MTVKLQPETIAYFKAAGVFRAKTDEKAREKFDESVEDFDGEDDCETKDALFTALIAWRDETKLVKLQADAARERKRQQKAEADAAKPLTASIDSVADVIKKMPHGRYVLTVAQNNTDIDPDMFAALQHYCVEMDATLLIARTTYNKGGFRQPDVNDTEGEKGAIFYDDAVQPYLVSGHIDLGGKFHFIADANVIVTTKWPTSGFDGIAPAGVGVIIPASKIELRVSAALKNAPNKVIAATGAITKRNYIMRKAGAQAAFAHSIGAIFVDTKKGTIRHLEQMEGTKGFYDMDRFFSPYGVKDALGHVAALQFGDIHAEKMERKNMKAALALIEQLQPANVILHDLLDFSSRNHHNIKDPTFIHAQMVAGNTVKGDLQKMAAIVDEFLATGVNLHVIESNHDLAINTWLKNADFKNDPVNAVVYLDCMLALYKHQEKGGKDYFNMLSFAYSNIGGGRFAESIDFHETDETLTIAGVEMGNHGHNGVNGARGNPKGFAALGVKMNTGHTHSPSIYGPCYTAGVTASLDMDYNKGASSWAIAHLVTYDNGQRQILFA
jgi:hypothetical protein